MTRPALYFALIVALAIGPRIQAAVAESARKLSMLVELSAGPMFGVDRPIKGCSGGVLLGAVWPPFEGALSADAAYDVGFRQGILHIDLSLGLGGDIRAIVGGQIPMGRLSLPARSDSSQDTIAFMPARWPNRFGLAATLARRQLEPPGASLCLGAELVYTRYAMPDASSVSQTPPSLSGAAAFAAGIEASLKLRLRWGGRVAP